MAADSQDDDPKKSPSQASGLSDDLTSLEDLMAQGEGASLEYSPEDSEDSLSPSSAEGDDSGLDFQFTMDGDESLEPGESNEEFNDELNDDFSDEDIDAEEEPEMEFIPDPGEGFAVTFTPDFEMGSEEQSESDLDMDSKTEPEPAPEPEPQASREPVSPPQDTLEQIHSYSESMASGAEKAQAAFPFSLSIEGHLKAEEKEKLLDTLSRHDMGIREMDLETQFEEGRILIPRISEYAGILLVQAMRSASVKMKLAPSDEVFSTSDTLEESGYSEVESRGEIHSDPDPHPAEHIPLNPAAPDANQQVIDAVTASAALRSRIVKAKDSQEYQELVERLQKEIKYKAFRKGASAVANFNITLTELSDPSYYRLTAIGSAVKPRPGSES